MTSQISLSTQAIPKDYAGSPMELSFPGRMLTIKQVQTLTTLSKASVFRGVAAGTFPAAIGLSAGGKRFRVGWRDSDVRGWLADPSAWRPPGS